MSNLVKQRILDGEPEKFRANCKADLTDLVKTIARNTAENAAREKQQLIARLKELDDV